MDKGERGRVPPDPQPEKGREMEGKNERVTYKPGRRAPHSVNLDINAAETVKTYLRTQNQTLSSWINWMIVEFAKQLNGQPQPFDKPVAKMTLEEFGEVLSYWKKSLEDLEPEGPETSPKV